MKTTLHLFLVLFFAGFPLLAQDLPIDPSFHYMERAAGTGFSGSLTDIQPVEDGKHLVAGNFASYNGKPARGLIRLLPDGLADPTFQTGSGFQTTGGEDFDVRSIQVQADSKLLVGGRFDTYNNSEARGLIRLNPDGSRDLSFSTGSGFDREVVMILLQSDGKLLVCGRFTTYQDEPVPSLIRLHTDGSRDTSFDAQGISENGTRFFALQEDGKILVNSGNDFFRLLPDGSLDTSFQLPAPFGQEYSDPDYGTIQHKFDVYSILLEENGKIWLSGLMQKSLRGMVSQLRLLPSGAVDESFYSPDEEIGFSDLRPHYFVKGEDEDDLVYTSRSPYGSMVRQLQRLLPDGRQDGSFTYPKDIPAEELQSLGTLLAVQTDGRLLVSGIRNEQTVIFRFLKDGSLDRSYNPLPEFNREVHSLTFQPDGKLLVAGEFSQYNGSTANGLARIHPDGRLDNTFDAGEGLDFSFYQPSLTLLPQEDGKILLVGNFIAYDQSAAGGIIRLLADGRPDSGFHTGTGFSAGASLPAVRQKDGKVLVAARFFNGEPVPGLIRLNNDGSKDPSLAIGTGFNGAIVAMAMAPGNKVVLAGTFTSVNGSPVNGLARLNPDGSLDASFRASEQLHIRPERLLVRNDGRILLAGLDGTTGTESILVRLNADGSLDPGFKSGVPASQRLGPLTLQPDGKVLLALGKYAPPNILTRLMPDGSVDPTFKMAYRFSGEIQTMTIYSRGNLLAGGSFTAFQDENVYRLAQIPDISNEPTPPETIFRINAGGPTIRYGQDIWLADTHFSGGNTYRNRVPISNTNNDAVYQSERNGIFSYEIPVPGPGPYTLELHFAEIYWERSGARLFDLNVENNPFRTNIDLVKDTGLKKASLIRIENLQVNDGHLSLELISRKDRAKISGIALFKQAQTETPREIRINAGGDALYYLGEEWLSDRYYQGGKTYTDASKPISATERDELHHSERYGEFSYRIPVPKAGRYFLELHFSEIFWEKEGERVFDVRMENGQEKLENIDLIKLIGEPNRAYMQQGGTFEILDGALDLEFVPKVNEAKLAGLRLAMVPPDTKAPVITQPEDLTLFEGEKWSYQVDAHAPTDGTILQYYAEGLPESVSLDQDTGEINGVFPSPGSYRVALKVTDQEGLAGYTDFSITVHPLTVVSRINAGGHSLQLGAEQWHANRIHPTGSIYSTTSPISNTERDTVYQSERNGDFSYEIKVPAKGLYTVELHFAEIHWNRENARLFRYQLENEPLSDIIDLYKISGGANRAYQQRLSDVQVVDGYLSLEMISVKDRAKLSGIVVYRQGTLASAARMATESQWAQPQVFKAPKSNDAINDSKLYPNPARGELNLEFEPTVPGVWQFSLVNSLGVSTHLDRLNLEQGRYHLKFDLSGYRLGAGTYYLRMESEKEASRVVRVIIH